MSEWYYSKGTQQLGPVPKAKLQALLDAGEVKPTDMAWTDGQGDWKELKALPAFRIGGAAPTPAKPATPSKREAPAPSRRPRDEDAPLPRPRRRRDEEEDEEDDEDDYRPRRRRRRGADGNGMATTALVLGCFGMIAWCIPFFGLPIGIAAAICGAKGAESDNRGQAVAGQVLGGICIVLSLINAVLGIILAVRRM